MELCFGRQHKKVKKERKEGRKEGRRRRRRRRRTRQPNKKATKNVPNSLSVCVTLATYVTRARNLLCCACQKLDWLSPALADWRLIGQWAKCSRYTGHTGTDADVYYLKLIRGIFWPELDAESGPVQRLPEFRHESESAVDIYEAFQSSSHWI